MNGWKLIEDNDVINKFKNLLINDDVNAKLKKYLIQYVAKI